VGDAGERIGEVGGVISGVVVVEEEKISSTVMSKLDFVKLNFESLSLSK